MDKSNLLSIGEVARRAGVAPSALRYYETLGLISSTRTAADRRRYERAVVRRIAVIRAAQRVGLSLHEITEAFRDLDPHRAPNKAEWSRISRRWRPLLEQRIADLEKLRDDLTGCIGCGCLSLKSCRLYNPDDVLGTEGSGSRRLFPDDGFTTDPA
ncbi:redox-sensitive transcriptional activator SoxR [Segeticoccus rhizosphaerae]|uniref:redox-sensitive transcriptional activator SoxR n=1 Tax=Segeticoccus rhizosphaerae TaxID=1104777 RepID=UPI00192E6939|nr:MULTISPECIES: redox-sensitive transcriptional activator SoxR [Intrasporangiaceae]